MTVAEALSAVYAVSGVAGCACYLPQIRGLLRSAQARRSLSLAAWGGWLVLGVVGVLYAALVVGQPEMLVVGTLNAACQAVVVALLAGQRWRDRRRRPGAAPSGRLHA